MDRGQLVPDDVTIRMLESEVNKHPEAAGFIFDGFRTTAQAAALDAFLEGKGQTISSMLALEVPEGELSNACSPCGHLRPRRRRRPGRHPKAHRRVQRRNRPVADHYRAAGKYQGIDGVGSIEDITERLTGAIGA